MRAAQGRLCRAVKMKSSLLFETPMHPATLDLTTFTCPTCKKAIETDGTAT